MDTMEETVLTEETPVPEKKKRPRSELASKSKPAKKPTKRDQMIAMLQRQSGATIQDMADRIGWKPNAVIGTLQFVLWVTRSGVRKVNIEKRRDGTTVYRAA
jgi:hypothetical protein